MTAIIIPRRHYTQPQGRVVVDAANYAGAQALAAFMFQGGVFDAVSERPYQYVSIGSSPQYTSGAIGGGLLANGAYCINLLPRNPEHLQRQAVTYYSVFHNAGSGNTGYVFSRAMGSSLPSVGIGVHNGSLNGWAGAVNGTTSDLSSSPVADIGSAATRVPATLVMTVGSGVARLFVNGVFAYAGAYGGDIDYSRADECLSIFRTGLGVSSFRGVLYGAGILDGALPYDAAIDLSTNPWQLFRADPIRIYSLPSSGTEQALAASGTATASATAQLAASIALAGVGVALASGSGTLSGAQSAPIAADGTATATGTAAPRIDIALSALGLAVAAGTATPDAATAGSLAASGAATATGSAGQVASVTISAAGLAQAAATAGLSADILRAGAGAAQAAGNAALAAQLAALAQGAAQASGTAAITGSEAGQLAAYGSAQALGSAALTLQVRLEVTGRAQAQGAATLDTGSAGELAGSGSAQAQGAAQVAATVVLTAAGFAQAMGAGYLVVQVDAGAIGAAQATGSAAPVDAEALVLIESARQRVQSARVGGFAARSGRAGGFEVKRWQ